MVRRPRSAKFNFSAVELGMASAGCQGLVRPWTHRRHSCEPLWIESFIFVDDRLLYSIVDLVHHLSLNLTALPRTSSRTSSSNLET
jgi:hypothetical protein